VRYIDVLAVDGLDEGDFALVDIRGEARPALGQEIEVVASTDREDVCPSSDSNLVGLMWRIRYDFRHS
jgi:hypothetical protein